MSDLFVDDSAKRGGAGRALMRAAAEYGRDLSIMLLDEAGLATLLED